MMAHSALPKGSRIDLGVIVAAGNLVVGLVAQSLESAKLRFIEMLSMSPGVSPVKDVYRYRICCSRH